jgi:predicted transcriptional regulator
MVSNTATDLGDEIRARRRALDLGQVDLAQAAACSLTQLRDLEQHRWTPKRSRAVVRIVATLERLEQEAA